MFPIKIAESKSEDYSAKRQAPRLSLLRFVPSKRTRPEVNSLASE